MKETPKPEEIEIEDAVLPVEQSIGDQEVRDRIIAAGHRLFMEHKYSRVTMEEIAAELGISKKTLYKHFPNKEEVLRAVTGRIKQEAAMVLDPLLQSKNVPFLDRLRSFMMLLSSQVVKIPPTVIEDIAKSAPAVWREFDQFRQERIRLFGELIKEGIDQGLLRSDLDREIVVSLFMAMMRGMMVPEKIVAEGHAPKEILRTIATVLFEGLLTESARGEFLHKV